MDTEISPTTKKIFTLPNIGFTFVSIVVLSLVIWQIVETSKSTNGGSIDAPVATASPTFSPTRSPIAQPPSTQAPTSSPTEPAPTRFPDINVKDYCATGTRYDRNIDQCVINPVAVSALSEPINELINENRILPNFESPDPNSVFYVKPEEDVIGNGGNIGVPDWFGFWLSKFGCDKNLGREIGCACGDCAGWRGGNATTCGAETIQQVSDTARVGCDLAFDPVQNLCSCQGDYCAVGGLCVSPFKEGPNGKIGCPSCILTKKEDGGCAGLLECDLGEEPTENIVEYPGKRYFCWDALDPARAPPGFDINDPNTFNLNFTSEQDFNTLCEEQNEYRYSNEYGCAYDCAAKYNNQLYCGLACLPKLWRWSTVSVNGEFKGFYQTPFLAQYESTDYELEICPNGQCVDDSNAPTDPLSLFNCKNCTECKWELNEVVDAYEYICDNCDACYPGGKKVCNQAIDCRLCRKDFTVAQGGNGGTQCEYCSSSNTSCVTYNDNVENPPPGEAIFYNNGSAYNPADYFVDSDEAIGCGIQSQGQGTCFGNNSFPGLNDGGIFTDPFGIIWILEKDSGECNGATRTCGASNPGSRI